MYTLNTLKINKFKETTVPSNRELFSRFGITKSGGNFTGDESAPTPKTKVETLSEVEKLAINKEE